MYVHKFIMIYRSGHFFVCKYKYMCVIWYICVCIPYHMFIFVTTRKKHVSWVIPRSFTKCPRIASWDIPTVWTLGLTWNKIQGFQTLWPLWPCCLTWLKFISSVFFLLSHVKFRDVVAPSKMIVPILLCFGKVSFSGAMSLLNFCVYVHIYIYKPIIWSYCWWKKSC